MKVYPRRNIKRTIHQKRDKLRVIRTNKRRVLDKMKLKPSELILSSQFFYYFFEDGVKTFDFWSCL
jgi:hypothetical protein